MSGKLRTVVGIALSVMLLVGLSGCSLLGLRLLGSWNMVRTSGEALPTGTTAVLTFKVDGTYEQVITFTLFGVSATSTENGQWAYNPLSKELQLTDRTVTVEDVGTSPAGDDETLQVSLELFQGTLLMESIDDDSSSEYQRS